MQANILSGALCPCLRSSKAAQRRQSVTEIVFAAAASLDQQSCSGISLVESFGYDTRMPLNRVGSLRCGRHADGRHEHLIACNVKQSTAGDNLRSTSISCDTFFTLPLRFSLARRSPFFTAAIHTLHTVTENCNSHKHHSQVHERGGTPPTAAMARVYADVNAQMPRSYWDYDSVVISWGVLENYEIVRKIGTYLVSWWRVVC